MSFEDEYRKAKDDGKTESVTQQIVSWEEEGQELFGVVVRTEAFTGGKFDSEARSYIMLTDQGMVTTVLGSATDKQLDRIDVKGAKLHITYRGKKDLEGSRQVNIFDVETW